MLIEIHAHTREHSACSRITAPELVTLLYNRNIQGIVLTDHHYLWQDEDLLRLRRKAAVGDEFLILSGQEVTTCDVGDVLVYGAPDAIGPGIDLVSLRARYPAAALVWAHPYRYGQLPSAAALLDPGFDAVEIINPHQRAHENRQAVRDWQELNFPATSGSDIHSSRITDFYPVAFDCDISDMGGLVACLKAGRCTPDLGVYGDRR